MTVISHNKGSIIKVSHSSRYDFYCADDHFILNEYVFIILLSLFHIYTTFIKNTFEFKTKTSV